MERSSSIRATKFLTFFLLSTLLCIILITDNIRNAFSRYIVKNCKCKSGEKLQATSIQNAVEEDVLTGQNGSDEDAITSTQNEYLLHDDSNQDGGDEYDYDRQSSMYSFPRVIIANACSGSSATIKFTEKIINAHSYEVLHGGQPFLYRKATVNHKGTHRINKARQDLIDSGSINHDRSLP